MGKNKKTFKEIKKNTEEGDLKPKGFFLQRYIKYMRIYTLKTKYGTFKDNCCNLVERMCFQEINKNLLFHKNIINCNLKVAVFYEDI